MGCVSSKAASPQNVVVTTPNDLASEPASVRKDLAPPPQGSAQGDAVIATTDPATGEAIARVVTTPAGDTTPARDRTARAADLTHPAGVFFQPHSSRPEKGTRRNIGALAEAELRNFRKPQLGAIVKAITFASRMSASLDASRLVKGSHRPGFGDEAIDEASRAQATMEEGAVCFTHEGGAG